MSTIRPTTPADRWLKQGEMLTRLKKAQDLANPGTWMSHYRNSLKGEYGFSERSEQLCRQGWQLWTFALDAGYREIAEDLLDAYPHVNDFVDALKRLKIVIRQREMAA